MKLGFKFVGGDKATRNEKVATDQIPRESGSRMSGSDSN